MPCVRGVRVDCIGIPRSDSSSAAGVRTCIASSRHGIMSAPYRNMQHAAGEFQTPCSTRACRGSPAVRAWTHIVKTLPNCLKKRRLRQISEVQPDLRGSLIALPTVRSSCDGPSCSHTYPDMMQSGTHTTRRVGDMTYQVPGTSVRRKILRI